MKNESKVYQCIENSDGNDHVVIFCQSPKAVKRLPAFYNVCGDAPLLHRLEEEFGSENIKIVQNALKM